MADSGISFKLFLDAAGFTSGVKAARDAMKNLIDETGRKGFFEKLNTDIKRVSTSFSQLGAQVSGGDIFGALATSSGLASASIGALGGAALPLAAVAIAAVSAGVAIKGMWDAMSKAKELKGAAEGSLMTVRELMGLEQAFGQVGVAIDEVPTLMNHFIDSLMQLGDASSKVSIDFQRIGLSLGSFKGKTTIEAFYTLAEAVQSAKNKSEALLAVQSAFGTRRAGRVFSVFDQGTLQLSQENTLKSADIYDKMGDAFIKMQYALSRMIPAFDSFFVGMTSKVVPAMEEAASVITRIDLTEVGEKIGSALSPITEAFGKLAYGLAALSKIATLTPFSREDDKKRIEFEWQEKRRQELIPGYKPVPYSKEAAEKNSIGSNPISGGGSMVDYKSEDRKNELKFMQIPMPIIAPIVDSLTKIGGGGTGGTGDAVDVQREQLNVLRDISTAVKAFSATFKPSKNTYMPSMYGDQSLVS